MPLIMSGQDRCWGQVRNKVLKIIGKGKMKTPLKKEKEEVFLSFDKFDWIKKDLKRSESVTNTAMKDVWRKRKKKVKKVLISGIEKVKWKK